MLVEHKSTLLVKILLEKIVLVVSVFVYLSSIKYVLDIGDRTIINISVLKKK